LPESNEVREEVAVAAKRWQPKECLQFCDYWFSLREKAEMPTTECCLDTLPALLVPSISILEVIADHTCVRFQSENVIESWGRDFTNKA
jgi:hypothetical protein